MRMLMITCFIFCHHGKRYENIWMNKNRCHAKCYMPTQMYMLIKQCAVYACVCFEFKVWNCFFLLLLQSLCVMVRNETTTNKKLRDFVQLLECTIRTGIHLSLQCAVYTHIAHCTHINAHWQANRMDFHIYTFQCQLMQHSFACCRHRSFFT